MRYKRLLACCLIFGSVVALGEAQSAYIPVLDLLMPRRPETIPTEAAWVAHIRMRDERREPELWMRVVRLYSEPAYSVDARQVWLQPLGQQIDQITRKSPRASIRRIADQVSQRSWRMGQCPAAVPVLARLERASVPAIMDNTLAMDPPIHEFSALFMGGEIDVQLTGTEAASDFRQILRDLASAILSCR